MTVSNVLSKRGLRVFKVAITTAADGSFSETFKLEGEILGIWVDKDDLSTPDVDISDALTGELCLTVNGVAADTMYHPKVLATDNAKGALTVTSNTYENYFVNECTVAITGGGNAVSGSIYFYVR